MYKLVAIASPPSILMTFKMSKCLSACGPNEEYDRTTLCEAACSSHHGGHLPHFCNEGCKCKSGYYRNDKGKCVKGYECDVCMVDGQEMQVRNLKYAPLQSLKFIAQRSGIFTEKTHCSLQPPAVQSFFLVSRLLSLTTS